MKKILSPITLLALLLASGCATKSIKPLSPPKWERLDAIRNNENLDASEGLAKSYMDALESEKKGRLAKACESFVKLAGSPEFPPRDAALVHTLGTCDFSKEELKKLWKKENLPTYLKEQYYKRSLDLAIKHKISEYEANFSMQLLPYQKSQADKLKLIKRALSIYESRKEMDKVYQIKKKLLEISPSITDDINPQNIFTVARDFESKRNFDKARSLYLKMINEKYPIAEKVKAYNAYRMSYKVQRDLKTFLEKTTEMESFLKKEMEDNPKDSKVEEAWADSFIAYTRAIWTDHQNDKAKKMIDQFIKTKKGNDNQKSLAELVMGSILIEAKENKKALTHYEKALNFKTTDQNQLENIQWAIVWNHYLLNHADKVSKFSEQFIKKSNNPNFIAKLQFWNAKALVRAHKKEEAKTLFTKLVDSDNFGYYGILASAELGLPLTPLAQKNKTSQLIGNLDFDWLVFLGESDLAQKILKDIEGDYKTNAQREKIMPLYAKTKWYQGGMRQIYNFKPNARNHLTEKFIDVIYPQAYKEIVSHNALKYSIPEELIWSIIRQESAFVANERSWADAFGLMQLIPEKAEEFSKKYKIKYSEFNDLYNPETNIEMGAALLSELKEKYKGKFAQSVAAYNASEDVIHVWEKERFKGNYLEFIEMIPYEETRNYIKLVFRNFITYKRLSSTESFMLDKDFFAKPFAD